TRGDRVLRPAVARRVAVGRHLPGALPVRAALSCAVVARGQAPASRAGLAGSGDLARPRGRALLADCTAAAADPLHPLAPPGCAARRGRHLAGGLYLAFEQAPASAGAAAAGAGGVRT